MADTPPGMKINFDEQNMTKWEVLMDGPEQSAYAVSVFGGRLAGWLLPCLSSSDR
jgi:ubiquitin-protein ligase